MAIWCKSVRVGLKGGVRVGVVGGVYESVWGCVRDDVRGGERGGVNASNTMFKSGILQEQGYCNKNIVTGTETLSIKQAFGNIVDQEEIAKVICKIIRKRATLLDKLEDMEKENLSAEA